MSIISPSLFNSISAALNNYIEQRNLSQIKSIGGYQSIIYDRLNKITTISGNVKISILSFSDNTIQTTAFTSEKNAFITSATQQIISINSSVATNNNRLNTIQNTMYTLNNAISLKQNLITVANPIQASLVYDNSFGTTVDVAIEQLQNDVNALSVLIEAKANTVGDTFTNTTFLGTITGFTKATVGLNNIDNTADLNKPISNAAAAALSQKVDLSGAHFTGPVYGITKSMVGLSNVSNVSDMDLSMSQATIDAIALKADLTGCTFTGTVYGITKSMVGLGNVDNTSDLLKPISKLEQDELDLKADLSGCTFTGIVQGLTKAMVNLGNVDNTADLNKPISTLQQAELDKKADLAGCTFTGPVSGITKSMVGLGNVDNNTDATKLISRDVSAALLTKINKTGGRFETDISLNGNLILSSASSKIKYNATSVSGQVLVNDANGVISLGAYPTLTASFLVVTGSLITTAIWTVPTTNFKTCGSIQLNAGNYIIYARVGILYSGGGSIRPTGIWILLNTTQDTALNKLTSGELDHYLPTNYTLTLNNTDGHIFPTMVTNISVASTQTYYLNAQLTYTQASGSGNVFITNTPYTGQSFLYAMKIA